MEDIKMDYNPFLNINKSNLSEEEISQLFLNVKLGDEKSLIQLVNHYSKIVESMILDFQSKNIPPKYTFTELYRICIIELKNLIIKYDETQFYKSVTWCIRQKILKAFATV